MQIHNLYSIYDRKAAYYLPVFTMRSHADAERQFTEIVTASETPVAKYPADYDLICLGEIDLETGRITPTYPVETLVNGLVTLQNAHLERSRYAKAVNQQVDLEELLAEQS
nr:MAG: nonstructural protein [Microvirus sp.]